MKKTITFKQLKTLVMEAIVGANPSQLATFGRLKEKTSPEQGDPAEGVYAYHCTNVDPEIIKKEGWKVGMGFTMGDFFDELDKKYLPKVPVYVTGDTREVWDTKARYCIKLDITGLKLYPDFGSLPDTGAFYDLDEKYFHWYDESGIGLTFTNNDAGQKMKEYVDSISPDEYILLPDDFSGEDSMRILGTAVVDGQLLTPDRIVGVKINQAAS